MLGVTATIFFGVCAVTFFVSGCAGAPEIGQGTQLRLNAQENSSFFASPSTLRYTLKTFTPTGESPVYGDEDAQAVKNTGHMIVKENEIVACDFSLALKNGGVLHLRFNDSAQLSPLQSDLSPLTLSALISVDDQQSYQTQVLLQPVLLEKKQLFFNIEFSQQNLLRQDAGMKDARATGASVESRDGAAGLEVDAASADAVSADVEGVNTVNVDEPFNGMIHATVHMLLE